jgi:hypothetical protein
MWAAFKDWLKEPYKGSMTALEWFLFIGLLLVAIVGWRFILAHLRGVTAEVAA